MRSIPACSACHMQSGPGHITEGPSWLQPPGLCACVVKRCYTQGWRALHVCCRRDFSSKAVLTVSGGQTPAALQSYTVACGHVSVPAGRSNVTMSVEAPPTLDTLECQQAAQYVSDDPKGGRPGDR